MRMLVLLRQFLAPFSGWFSLHYPGLALLPVIFISGLFNPRLAFGIAVWAYVMLLAVPFAIAPRVLRSLLTNRRLSLVPGFSQQALLVALLMTLLQAMFLPAFAIGYGVPGRHWMTAGELFAVNSLYLLVMYHAVTTRWAPVVLGIVPILTMATALFVLQGFGSRLLDAGHVLALAGATLLGWLVAWLHLRRQHSFKPEHASVAHLRSGNMQHGHLSQWMLAGGNALTHPDATLLLGYPATLGVRLRFLSWQVLLGPAIGTFMLVLMTQLDFSRQWTFQPGIADIFLLSSLFPATFAAYSNLDWVARLRLLWLRSPLHRNQLWQFLERQMWVSIALLLVLSSGLTAIGLAFAQAPVTLMLHFPLLVLVFNAFYSYYMICSRSTNWSVLYGMLLSFSGSGLMFAALWLALRYRLEWPLFVLELLLLLLALALREQAQRKIASVDWLRVKPQRIPFAPQLQ